MHQSIPPKFEAGQAVFTTNAQGVLRTHIVMYGFPS